MCREQALLVKCLVPQIKVPHRRIQSASRKRDGHVVVPRILKASIRALISVGPCAAGRSVQKPGQLRKVGNPGSVREQLTYGYAASRVPAVIRQVLGEMSIQGYLAIVDELQDEHRCEL